MKGAISAFFRARSINNRASREENTNLAPFNFKFGCSSGLGENQRSWFARRRRRIKIPD
ncbi:hypothetical protein IKF20_00020 [Candidatus Saccharibacteria bacterium]|nr:hypothetical protein [Candidatus Saccharibacteria bacterium]